MQRKQVKIDSTRYWNRMSNAAKAELAEWKKHPELKKIASHLKPRSDISQFLNHFAEYVIARRFRQIGCEIAIEVPTQKSRRGDFKHADLKVWKGPDCLYAHVKRLNPDENHARQVLFGPLFEMLEEIARPVVVELCLRPDLTFPQAHFCCKWAKSFIPHARIGQEETIFDHHGIKLGTIAILAEHNGVNARVAVHYGMQRVKDRDRLPKKFTEARDQFMPGATNVVFIAWDWVSDSCLTDFENVLLGSTCAVADLDPNGKLVTVPTGRKADGFWSGTAHPDSQAACCFRFIVTTGAVEFKTWIRPGREQELLAWFRDSFQPVTELAPPKAASTLPA